jgi:hypothetical protein
VEVDFRAVPFEEQDVLLLLGSCGVKLVKLEKLVTLVKLEITVLKLLEEVNYYHVNQIIQDDPELTLD